MNQEQLKKRAKRFTDELNLPIDMCGGTSAGSLVGAAVAMFRGNYELVKEVTRRVAKLTSTSFFYVLDFTLPILSLVQIEQNIKKQTSGTFMNEVTMDAYSNKLVENTFLPFFAVSTDVTDVSVTYNELINRIGVYSQIWLFMEICSCKYDCNWLSSSYA